MYFLRCHIDSQEGFDQYLIVFNGIFLLYTSVIYIESHICQSLLISFSVNAVILIFFGWMQLILSRLSSILKSS